jgi:hypothetical protein
MASVGSSHNRLVAAEDIQEALLFACPAIGLVDENEFRITDSEKARALYPRPETPRLYGQGLVKTTRALMKIT